MAKAKTEKVAEEVAKVVTYVFRHPNAYLSVPQVNAQFVNGRYETTDRAVAEYLINIEDIELISQQ